MRRIVVIVPDLFREGDALPRNLAHLDRLAEMGTLLKLAPLPRIETPEALYLGMSPTEAQMRPGPLIVSALGADPPERSTHFIVTLMSQSDGIAQASPYLPTPDEMEKIWAAARRLNTPKLTLVRGEALEHGLVWEELGDMGTTSAEAVSGRPIRESRPEGDGERVLRRFIDDSVNLLSELELNARRTDAGHPPFNLLWPWGQGVRVPVPNLALRRGEPATVESASFRLAGVTRLAGYRHEDRAAFGTGLSARFEAIAQRALGRTISILVVEGFIELRARDSNEREEEIDWLAREMDRRLFGPIAERIFDPSRDAPLRLSVLAPSTSVDSIGLGLEVRSDARQSNPLPFDARSLEERAPPTVDLASRVERGVGPYS